MDPQDPGVTGRSLVDRMDNSTRLYKSSTHRKFKLWVARHSMIIRRIDMVRVPQRTSLQGAVLDDWRYSPPFIFGLACTRYERGLKSTVHR